MSKTKRNTVNIMDFRKHLPRFYIHLPYFLYSCTQKDGKSNIPGTSVPNNMRREKDPGSFTTP